VLELENERVRVYRVRLDTGTKRSAHRHPGAVLAVVARGEGSAEAESGSSLAPGDFRWHEGGSLPTVEAAERSEMEIVEIEWK
jgi:quercetin dioxygenase-like cupin family protein